MTSATLKLFSKNAAELLQLRCAMWGKADVKALMKRCINRSKGRRVNRTTVLACWKEQDEAIDAALAEPDLILEVLKQKPKRFPIAAAKPLSPKQMAKKYGVTDREFREVERAMERTK